MMAEVGWVLSVSLLVSAGLGSLVYIVCNCTPGGFFRLIVLYCTGVFS